MKKALLFALSIFATFSLQAELTYINYGSTGWHVAANENVVVDVDNDGANDFYINGYSNELGFVPIFAKGCFSSLGDMNNIGTQKLTLHESGDILNMSMNTIAFIDGDRGSAANLVSGTLADGWVDKQDVYIGFYIFTSHKFGWMRVAVDMDNEEMIIKEMGYGDSYEPIEVGYTGLPDPIAPELIQGKFNIETEVTATNELEKDLQALKIAPNPATEKVNISLNYKGEANLSIIVVNSVGKEMYRRDKISSKELSMDIPIDNWTSGIYFIQFQSEKGIKTERLSVVH
ncbi:MAG TPA: T9SS type A sorting domain-containing protein [Phaeodactylibacter sp.]|nr:T9SS type A sorting domain-containing protein [Phaeodactylibacter sp.]